MSAESGRIRRQLPGETGNRRHSLDPLREHPEWR